MSKVIVVKAGDGYESGKMDTHHYRNLISVGIAFLTQDNAGEKAIKNLLPGGTTGMKINALTGKLNSTSIELVDGLAGLLATAGFDENNLIIWDRTNRELEKAGYSLNASSFERRCFGTDTGGIGYSRDFFSSGDVDCMVSRILTDHLSSNINLPVLKDHSIAGLSAGLKNMYGAIHNPNKYHDNNCDPYAADIYNLEPIRSKNQLTIIDAVRVQYNGGPGYDSRYLADYGGIIISQDVVAADSVGLRILEHYRKLNGLPTLKETRREVKYLKSASERGLGTYEWDKIDLDIAVIDTKGNTKPTVLF
jgi:uncharacterized protein (DUF362 family)